MIKKPYSPLIYSQEKGQSMVEFAVSAIVILLLLVAIADFGRAFFTYLTLRDAAQEGAVYASVCPIHLDGIENRIRSASTRPVDLSDPSQVIFECHYLYDEFGNEVECHDQYSPRPAYLPIPGHSVRIRVEYPNFAVTTPLLGSIIGQNINLHAEVIDTILLPATPPDETCP
jgi:hypothetical protein